MVKTTTVIGQRLDRNHAVGRVRSPVATLRIVKPGFAPILPGDLSVDPAQASVRNIAPAKPVFPPLFPRCSFRMLPHALRSWEVVPSSCAATPTDSLTSLDRRLGTPHSLQRRKGLSLSSAHENDLHGAIALS